MNYYNDDDAYMILGIRMMTIYYPQIYNCHLCTFSADTRVTFSNHVNTHYQFQCVKCEFETKVGQNVTNSQFSFGTWEGCIFLPLIQSVFSTLI